MLATIPWYIWVFLGTSALVLIRYLYCGLPTRSKSRINFPQEEEETE